MSNSENMDLSKIRIDHVTVELPGWVDSIVDWQKEYIDDNDKMALAIELSYQNVVHRTGGPFGTAIFDKESNKLLGVGVNRVMPLNNSILHGELVAIMMAEKMQNCFSLGTCDSTRELFTSCEPCAMCLGGILWSGVKRVVCAACGDDARAIGFDEGPVFPESYIYLENAGIEIIRGFARDEAKKILEFYKDNGGEIYNGINGN